MYEYERKTELCTLYPPCLWLGVAVSGVWKSAAPAGRQCCGLPRPAVREHVLPACCGLGSETDCSASAHRHRLESAGQAPLLAGGVVWPGGVHRTGGAALLCSVFVPAGPLRKLAGDSLRRRDGCRDSAQPVGCIQPQLHAGNGSVCNHAGPAHQHAVCSRGRSGLARVYDAPAQGTLRSAQWPSAGRRHLGRVALAHHAAHRL